MPKEKKHKISKQEYKKKATDFRNIDDIGCIVGVVVLICAVAFAIYTLLY